MRRCPNCGSDVPGGQDYCGGCGADVRGVNQAGGNTGNMEVAPWPDVTWITEGRVYNESIGSVILKLLNPRTLFNFFGSLFLLGMLALLIQGVLEAPSGLILLPLGLVGLVLSAFVLPASRDRILISLGIEMEKGRRMVISAASLIGVVILFNLLDSFYSF